MLSAPWTPVYHNNAIIAYTASMDHTIVTLTLQGTYSIIAENGSSTTCPRPYKFTDKSYLDVADKALQEAMKMDFNVKMYGK
jgi:hypothetical protein